MNNARPLVTLTCGLTCSGKSTHARELAADGAVWLSLDQDAWDQGCTEQPLPPEVQKRLKIEQKQRLRSLIAEGCDVVLEYAFASRTRREEYRAIAEAAGAEVRIVYFDVPADELHRRLEARNQQPLGPHTVRVSHEQLDRWLRVFEVPGADEAGVVHLRWDSNEGELRRVAQP